MLTEAHLDRQQRARELARLPLHEVLRQSGAIQGPYRRARPYTLTPWLRIKRALRTWFIKRLAPRG